MPESVLEDIATQKDVSENIMTHWDVPEEISTPEGVSEYVRWFKSRGRGHSRWSQVNLNEIIIFSIINFNFRRSVNEVKEQIKYEVNFQAI